MNSNIFVISLGGSLIVPDNIDTSFLSSFKSLITQQISIGKKFVLIAGGGKTCRKYQDAAAQVTNLSNDDKDWLGVHTTRLNAHLIRTVFRDYAYPVINKNPTTLVDITSYLKKHSIMVAAGWKPGWSTDYIAVRLASRFNCTTVINLSNVDYVYNKDPNIDSSAVKLPKISWKDYIQIVGTKWTPGLNSPFDPIASKLAFKNKTKVIITNGSDFENLNNILNNSNFNGTIIG